MILSYFTISFIALFFVCCLATLNYARHAEQRLKRGVTSIELFDMIDQTITYRTNSLILFASTLASAIADQIMEPSKGHFVLLEDLK